MEQPKYESRGYDNSSPKEQIEMLEQSKKVFIKVTQDSKNEEWVKTALNSYDKEIERLKCYTQQ